MYKYSSVNSLGAGFQKHEDSKHFIAWTLAFY